ncbi:MAG: DNA polymerase III subunit epsilon [Henriciella sp.]|nr:DNA polymerase III subunit epsilon [Henriciella sp.]
MTETVREIAFDTETTGLEWDKDDRIIELGAVELINHVSTGRTFQTYINPGRPVSEATIRITGITDDDLKDKPGFHDPSIVDAFLDFIGDSTLVAHNAKFDRGFLNMELERCGRTPVPEDRWVDTVAIARKRFPGAPASLDALCKRFDVNSDARTYHGALLDSQLLAEVYLELLGGRARAFDFGSNKQVHTGERQVAIQRPEPRPVEISADEETAHAEFVASLGEKALWARYASG